MFLFQGNDESVIGGLDLLERELPLRKVRQYLGCLPRSYNLNEGLHAKRGLHVMQCHIAGMLDLDPVKLGINDDVALLREWIHRLECLGEIFQAPQPESPHWIER